MRWLAVLAYGVAIIGVTVLVLRETIEPSAYLYQNHSGSAVALGLAGWLIATLGPLVLSIGIFLAGPRQHGRWALHLLFMPLAILIYRVGASLLFRAAGVPDGDSVEGYALLLGEFFLLVALLAHATAFAVEGYKGVRRLSGGSF